MLYIVIINTGSTVPTVNKIPATPTDVSKTKSPAVKPAPPAAAQKKRMSISSKGKLFFLKLSPKADSNSSGFVLKSSLQFLYFWLLNIAIQLFLLIINGQSRNCEAYLLYLCMTWMRWNFPTGWWNHRRVGCYTIIIALRWKFKNSLYSIEKYN